MPSKPPSPSDRRPDSDLLAPLTAAQSRRHRTANVVAADYEPGNYPTYAVTVDVVILTVRDEALHLLVVQRSGDPYGGWWALPGGFKTPDETLDEAARRELAEETEVSAPPHLGQLGTYGDPGRDARTNVVSVAYLAPAARIDEVRAGSDADDARLIPVNDVLSRRTGLAFDHTRIVADAVEFVRSRLETTDLATKFVGSTFTLTELRRVYEAAWDIRIDPANFRRSVLDADVVWVERTLERSGSTPKGGRPPELFTATDAWRSGSPVRRPRRR